MDQDGDGSSSRLTLANLPRYVAIVVGSVAAGLLAGWAVLPVERTVFGVQFAVWVAVLVWLATAAFLSTRDPTTDVVGSALYITAVLVVLKPIASYAPVVRAATAAAGRRRSKLLIEGLGGLLTWGLLAGVLAVVFVALGRRARAHARRTKVRRGRKSVQEEADTADRGEAGTGDDAD